MLKCSKLTTSLLKKSVLILHLIEKWEEKWEFEAMLLVEILHLCKNSYRSAIAKKCFIVCLYKLAQCGNKTYR